jgi:hypothetical protein
MAKSYVNAEIVDQKLADRAVYFESLPENDRLAEMVREVADELTMLNATIQLIASNVGPREH